MSTIRKADMEALREEVRRYRDVQKTLEGELAWVVEQRDTAMKRAETAEDLLRTERQERTEMEKQAAEMREDLERIQKRAQSQPVFVEEVAKFDLKLIADQATRALALDAGKDMLEAMRHAESALKLANRVFETRCLAGRGPDAVRDALDNIRKVRGVT